MDFPFRGFDVIENSHHGTRCRSRLPPQPRDGEVPFIRYPIRAGDVIACPAGGKETAHQIINSGSDELRYLAVSTKLSPEIADYPDSGKFGVLAELPADADGKPRRFMFVGRENESLNYWEGE